MLRIGSLVTGIRKVSKLSGYKKVPADCILYIALMIKGVKGVITKWHTKNLNLAINSPTILTTQ